MNDICKLCKEPLPVKALHFSNEIAIAHGYCCWMCMLSNLGFIKAHTILREEAGRSGREGRK